MFEIEFLRGDTSIPPPPPIEDEKGKQGNSISMPSENKGNISRPVSPYETRRESVQGIKNILLKGEMRYIEDIDSIIFLCSPV